jgi:hypothetical protein
MMMVNRSHRNKTPVSLYEQLRQLGPHISWPLFVITVEGLGFVLITSMLWWQGFDVIGRAPHLIVLVVLWLIAEVFLWVAGD